jgi:hypothetical protein
MDELLKRLAEIRERAAAIKAGEIGEAEIKELRELKDERLQIEQKVEALKVADELTAESEAEKPAEEEKPAEGGEGDKPAENPVEEERPDEVVKPGETGAPKEDEEKPAEVTPGEEAPTPEALAAAASSLGSNDGGLGSNDAGKGLTIIASAASFGVQAGEGLVAESFNRIHRIASGAAAGVKQTFGTIQRHSGEEAVSARKSAIENTLLMSRPREKDIVPVSLTAAACYCGPNEVDKSIESRGRDERPFAAAFRSVPFTGPFDYVREMNLDAVQNGVTLWDCDAQEAVTAANPATWKPCVTLDCGDSVTVTPYAIPACGNFSIFQQLSHPELVDDFINKIGIYYARLAEQALIDKVRADNTHLTYGVAGMGLLHQITGALGQLAAITGYTRRLGWEDYTLFLPPGMITALVADEHRRGFSRGATREAILTQIRDLGVGNVVEMIDLDTTAEPGLLTAAGTFIAPGTTVPLNICNLPATWTVHLVPTDAYIRGESTLVEAGYQRDADLLRQNMVQYFFEGHEFIEKRDPNVPGWTIELSGAATGGASALVTPEAC